MEFDEVEKVYGTDPLTCPKCGSEMEIKAIIMDPQEVNKVLRHLVKDHLQSRWLFQNQKNEEGKAFKLN